MAQSRGSLAAARNCVRGEALGHPATLSQHETVGVAEVAARIMGGAMPDTPDEPVQVKPPQVDARLFDPLTYLHGAPVGAGAADEPLESVDLPVLPAEVRVRLQTAAAAVQPAETLTDPSGRGLGAGNGQAGARSGPPWG